MTVLGTTKSGRCHLSGTLPPTTIQWNGHCQWHCRGTVTFTLILHIKAHCYGTVTFTLVVHIKAHCYGKMIVGSTAIGLLLVPATSVLCGPTDIGCCKLGKKCRSHSVMHS